MPRNVYVGNKLKFKDGANTALNIQGNWNTDKMVLYDDFTAVALDSERWVFAGNNGGTEAITAGANGTATLTTGATDNDRSLLASPLMFLCANNPIIEARFSVSAGTTIGVNFGFNDATTEGDNALAMGITSGAATLVNGKTSDGAMFVYDTDGSIDHLYVAGTKADAEGTPVLAKCVAVVEDVSTNVPKQYLNAGSNTITIDKTGSFTIWLPSGAAGTLTDGTGTFTGSVISLTEGLNTIACTAIGTATVVHGFALGTTAHIYRVALDSLGNATFSIDGVAVGGLAACLTTTAPLCAFLGVIARTTSARVLTVDYIKAWTD